MAIFLIIIVILIIFAVLSFNVEASSNKETTTDKNELASNFNPKRLPEREDNLQY